jgi:hypothetical protein
MDGELERSEWSAKHVALTEHAHWLDSLQESGAAGGIEGRFFGHDPVLASRWCTVVESNKDALPWRHGGISWNLGLPGAPLVREPIIRVIPPTFCTNPHRESW